MNQVELDYQRYTKLCEFAGKPVPMFEQYLASRGLPLEKYLTPEELEDAKRVVQIA